METEQGQSKVERGKKIPEEVIERLRSQKQKYKEEQFEIGRDVGYEWAGDADYEEIVTMVNDTFDRENWGRLLEGYIREDAQSYPNGGGVQDWDLWQDGFKQGAQDFLGEVEKHLFLSILPGSLRS